MTEFPASFAAGSSQPITRTSAPSIYLAFAVCAGLIGGTLSVIMRYNLMTPGDRLFGDNHQLYNVIITEHGLTMIFFVVMPALIGDQAGGADLPRDEDAREIAQCAGKEPRPEADARDQRALGEPERGRSSQHEHACHYRGARNPGSDREAAEDGVRMGSDALL